MSTVSRGQKAVKKGDHKRYMIRASFTDRDLTSLTVSVVISTLMPNALLLPKSVCVLSSIDRYIVVQGIQIYDVFFFALKTKVLETDVTVIFCVSRTQRAGLYITVRADGARIHAHVLNKVKKIRCTILTKHRYIININVSYGVSMGFYGVLWGTMGFYWII